MRALLGLAVALVLLGAAAAPARAEQVTKDVKFTASDGAELYAQVAGEGDLRPRPTILEFTPYAESCCNAIGGPEYNYVKIHARGTGRSDGHWTATGPRDQQDVAEFMKWACRQPWSDGRLALYGFSASAIVAYNAMDLKLPCLKTAVLMAGSADLYRDLLYIGGIPNFVPGAVVLFGVGGLALAQAPERLKRPHTALDPLVGDVKIGLEYLTRPTHDEYWDDRVMNPKKLKVPLLVDTGFYDVEARGPFEAFKQTKHLGSHLLLLGAHDGHPAGTGGPFPHYKRWFDRYVRGVRNGIDREPTVQAWIGKGSRQELLAGKVVKHEGADWPLPGTKYTPLHLSGERSGTAKSLNDGTLSLEPARAEAQHPYPALPSNPLASDPYTTSTVDHGEISSLVPPLTRMNQAEPTSATYTSPPLAEDLDVVGPASLHVRLASTAPEADIHAVVADVWPDGTAHPIAAGRLRTSFPDTVAKRNVVDPESGEIIQPYADFEKKTLATPGVPRDYDVEIWPIGNRFAKGHRIRLYLTGTALFALPPLPGVNTVTVGGDAKARLVLPSVGGTPAFSGPR